MLKKILMLAATATLCATQAFAAMPLVTDDTGTKGTGRVQVEFGVDSHRHKEFVNNVSVRETGTEISTTISYGLSKTVDLIAGLPLSWNRIDENGISTFDEHGLSDLSLQVKWRFLEANDGDFSLALKPGITLPTGAEEKGLGTGRVTEGALLIATHKGRFGTLHFNVGYNRNDYRREEDRIASRKNIWHASIAGEVNVTDGLRAVADTGIQTNQQKGNGTHPLYLLGGLIYSPSDRLDVDLGFKGGLNHAAPDSTLLAGVTLHF